MVITGRAGLHQKTESKPAGESQQGGQGLNAHGEQIISSSSKLFPLDRINDNY